MKKGIWIIAVIIGILLGTLSIVVFNQMRQSIPSSAMDIDIDLGNEIANIQQTNDKASDVSETNVIENENKIQNTVENENTVTKEILDEAPQTEEDKAIQIVKKDYGTDSNVKIAVEGMDENGREIVVVRETETTKAIAFYFVNVSSGTFDKKEMN